MKDLPIPEPEAAEVERQIADILDSPEYDYTDPWYKPITDWISDQLDSVFRWIGRRLEDFFGLFEGAGIGGVDGAGLAVRVLAYALVGLLVLFMARLIWRVIQSRQPKPVSYSRQPVVEINRWYTPKELLADAERFEKEGRWDEALRARYRHVIADLVERRLIENPPGRTTGEYVAEVDHWLPASSAGFATITQTFERVWYGDAPADKSMVDDLRRTGETVLSLAKKRASSGVADSHSSTSVDPELVG